MTDRSVTRLVMHITTSFTVSLLVLSVSLSVYLTLFHSSLFFDVDAPIYLILAISHSTDLSHLLISSHILQISLIISIPLSLFFLSIIL